MRQASRSTVKMTLSAIEELREPVALVTPVYPDYLSGLSKAMDFITSYGGTYRIADLPTSLQLIAAIPEVKARVEEGGNVHTRTSQFLGKRYVTTPSGIDEKVSFEVVHGLGFAPATDDLENYESYLRNSIQDPGMKSYLKDVILIDDNLWDSLAGMAFYHNDVETNRDISNIVLTSLEEIKRGNLPEPGTLYSIIAHDKDSSPFISQPGSWLDYDTFMRDDRMLMLAGSLENRELLAQIYFSPKDDGGWGNNIVYNDYRIGRIGANPDTFDRLDCSIAQSVTLGEQERGIGGGFGAGRFVLVHDNFYNKNHEDPAPVTFYE